MSRSELPEVVTRPTGDFSCSIWASDLIICGYDNCTAAVLNKIEYWYRVRIQNNEIRKARARRGETENSDEFVYRTYAQLHFDLLHEYGRTKVAAALENLERLGFLSIHERQGEVPRYEYHPDAVQDAMNRMFGGDECDGKAGRLTLNPTHTFEYSDSSTHPKMDGGRPKMDGTHPILSGSSYIEKKEEREQKDNLPPACDQREHHNIPITSTVTLTTDGKESPKDSAVDIQDKGQERETVGNGSISSFPNPLPPSPSADIAIDNLSIDGILDSDEMVDGEGFLKRYKGYGLPKAKRPNAGDKAFVAIRWSPVASPDLEGALKAWESDEWAKAHNYPIRTFVLQRERWIEAGRHEAGAAQVKPPKASGVSGRCDSLIRPSAPERDYVGEWGRAFPGSPLPKEITDAEFKENFDAVLAKSIECKALPNDPWLQRLPWLLKKSKDGVENWKELLHDGKYDWKLNNVKKANAYDMDAVEARILERFRREHGTD